MIRLVIVDDHPIVADAISRSLGSDSDISVVAICGTVAEARAALAEHDVDVVVVDIRLPDGSGLELIREAALGPDPPSCLVLSSFETPQYIDAAMRFGARGFLLKTAPTQEILDAIRRLAMGGSAYHPDVVRHVAGEKRWIPLTPKDREIVAGVLRGRSNDEIAADLGMSRKTVESHLSRMFIRYDVVTRTDLAVRAEREGWLDLPSRAG